MPQLRPGAAKINVWKIIKKKLVPNNAFVTVAVTKIRIILDAYFVKMKNFTEMNKWTVSSKLW